MKRSAYVFALVMFLAAISVNADQFLRADVANIWYDEYVFQSRWIEDEVVSDTVQRDRQERQLSIPKNGFVPYDITHWVKKSKWTFSPRIFIQPILIIEEFQASFSAYQSEETERVDGLVYGQRVVISTRRFSFIPCYRKIYGIYLQIVW